MHLSTSIYRYEQFVERALQLIERAAAQNTRALLAVFSPPPHWLEDFSKQTNSIFLSATSVSDRSDRISSLLGSERQVACIQMAPQPDLGLLAALAGTIHSGGLLVVGINEVLDCAPPAYDPLARLWNNTPNQGSYQSHDPNSDAALDHAGDKSFESRYSRNRSTARLASLIKQAAIRNPDTISCVKSIGSKSFGDPYQPEQPKKQVSTPRLSLIMPEHVQASANNPEAVAEQDALYVQACDHWDTFDNSCIVIRGRRGRGKSTLLARLTQHLQSTCVSYLVTARHKAALKTIEASSFLTTTHYVSPEGASQQFAQVLLVEEAANLSIAQLKSYLTAYPHVVLCTTTEGYENAGRALDIRLLHPWNEPTRQLLELTPRHPWRWQAADPLERLLDKLCLSTHYTPTDKVDIEQKQLALSTDTWPKGAVRRINRDELTHNEKLLSDVYALLYESHYQSTTKDLIHLLDAPSLELWVLETLGSVDAVLWMEHEGQIDPSLHEPVVSKQRRLPNQLLPQLLAQSANDQRALTKRYIRIVRLAVASSLRRQGLGSQLLRRVTLASQTEQAKVDDLAADAIGASFSSDPVSQGFWQHHGYLEFHHGYRKNPRTGRQSIACLKSFEPSCSSVLNKAQAIHFANELARAKRLPQTTTVDRFTELELGLLLRFSRGQRSMHDTIAVINKTLANAPEELRSKYANNHKTIQSELREHVSQWLDGYHER